MLTEEILNFQYNNFKFYSPKKDITMTSIQESQGRVNGRWTKEEHQKFLYGLKLFGKNWKKIQDIIQTRSSTQIRSHAQKFFIKNKKCQQYASECDSEQFISRNKNTQDTITCQSIDGQNENTDSSFSFYFQQIRKSFLVSNSTKQEFNFWSVLIDFPKQQKCNSCPELFVQTEFGTKLNTNDYEIFEDQGFKFQGPALTRTKFSCFEAYQKDQCKNNLI